MGDTGIFKQSWLTGSTLLSELQNYKDGLRRFEVKIG